jgi:hypothetical protein
MAERIGFEPTLRKMRANFTGASGFRLGERGNDR